MYCKFLNRMLAMSLRDQKLLFAYFSDTLVSVPYLILALLQALSPLISRFTLPI